MLKLNSASPLADWLCDRTPGQQDQRDPADVWGAHQDREPSRGRRGAARDHHWLARLHSAGSVPHHCLVSMAGGGRGQGTGGGGREPLPCSGAVPWGSSAPPLLSIIYLSPPCCLGYYFCIHSAHPVLALLVFQISSPISPLNLFVCLWFLAPPPSYLSCPSPKHTQPVPSPVRSSPVFWLTSWLLSHLHLSLHLPSVSLSPV